MIRIPVQSGDETADVTPEFAVALNRAMGGEPGAQGFAAGAPARYSPTVTQPEAQRASPMPAASPLPPASALPPASPIPPATSVPESPRPHALRRSATAEVAPVRSRAGRPPAA